MGLEINLGKYGCVGYWIDIARRFHIGLIVRIESGSDFLQVDT